MYDEASLHRYGSCLPTIEEDAVPAKKPVRPEDQIVTDENGKRRFHGAFTGGFSAGYWNTVGSQEGWTPSSFKSSRGEKAPARAQQRPEDFMDGEDLGEFGIAPQRLQPRNEYTQATTQKQQIRKRRVSFCMQPIPGEPVLAQLMQPRESKIGERILQSMGWREGEGIGPRLNPREKQHLRQQRRQEAQRMGPYGAGGDSDLSMESSADDMDMYDAFEGITLAPDDYEPHVCNPKADRFGLGYREMLSEDPALNQHFTASEKGRHINLFEQPSLQIVDKNNRKVNIHGQAFGVGAYEDEDEDIYAQDDMTRYDYTLEDKKKPKAKKEKSLPQFGVLEGFQLGAKPTAPLCFEVNLPEDFIPRNWQVRKSRFTPLEPERAKKLDESFKRNEKQRKWTPLVRGEMLEEICNSWTTIDGSSTSTVNESTANRGREPMGRERVRREGGLESMSSQSTTTSLSAFLTSSSDRFLPGETLHSRKQEECFTPSTSSAEDSASTATLRANSFQPFITNPSKQRRYEEFLAADIKSERDIAQFLNKIQPLAFSEFDRQLEQKEFLQAQAIYKPLEGAMAERFVSGSNSHCAKSAEKPAEKAVYKEFSIQRTNSVWVPVSLLCKRFNIAEPHGAAAAAKEKPTPSAKLSIFTYLEGSMNKRSNFQTPVIIPRAQSKLQPVVEEQQESTTTGSTNTKTKPQSPPRVAPARSPSPMINTPLPKPISPTRHVSEGAKTGATHLPGRHVPKTDLEKRIEEMRDKKPWEKLDVFEAVFAESSDDEDQDTNKQQQKHQLETTATQTTTANTATTSTSTRALNDNPNPNPQTVTNAAAANLLRNTSPPRGIFKALFDDFAEKNLPTTVSAPLQALNVSTDALKVSRMDGTSSDTKILFQPRRERLTMTSASSSSIDVYGPKLPDHIKRTFSSAGDGNDATTVTAASATNDRQLDDKLCRLLQTHRSGGDLPKRNDDDDDDDNEGWTEKLVAVISSNSNREQANNATSDSSDSSASSESSDESHSHKQSSGERVKRKVKNLKKSIKKKKNKSKKKSIKEADEKHNKRKSKKKKDKKTMKKSKKRSKTTMYPIL